jgi:hypothetical protein
MTSGAKPTVSSRVTMIKIIDPNASLLPTGVIVSCYSPLSTPRLCQVRYSNYH